MVIPKGSTVILNVWGLHNDPSCKPPPEVFEPDRFVDCPRSAAEYVSCSDPTKRDHYAFGAGRRVCPGIHMAERGLFVGIAKLLWAFSFNQILDEHGEPLPIDVDFETGYTHGFAHCPKPFPCQVRLRRAEQRDVIFEEFEQAQREVFSKFEP
jgi:cytochrome P450